MHNPQPTHFSSETFGRRRLRVPLDRLVAAIAAGHIAPSAIDALFIYHEAPDFSAREIVVIDKLGQCLSNQAGNIPDPLSVRDSHRAPMSNLSIIPKPCIMTAVHICIFDAPTARSSTASRQLEIPPFPEIAKPWQLSGNFRHGSKRNRLDRGASQSRVCRISPKTWE